MLFLLRNIIFLNNIELIWFLLIVNKLSASKKSFSLEVEQEYTAKYFLASLLNIRNLSSCLNHHTSELLSKFISLSIRYSVTSLVNNCN